MASPKDRAALPERPFLYAIIDAAMTMTSSRSLSEWVELLAGEGRAAVVQWRFKGLADREALAGARELRAATQRAGVLFFVNDRPDIARMVDADGLHVGQDDLSPSEARALLPNALLGVSTHNPAQFEVAAASEADYIAVGPVFATHSKAAPDPVVGLEFVAWAAARSPRPIVAIGGLNAGNAGSAVRSGARGVAVISELMKAPDPGAAARALVGQIALGAS